MGQESTIKIGATAGTAGGDLPTTTAGSRTSSRGRQIHKTFNNFKITILCGFVTILVLRGTIGISNLGRGDTDADEVQRIAQETQRILVEIRSDKDSNDLLESDLNYNVTYMLGPKMSNWDEESSRSQSFAASSPF